MGLKEIQRLADALGIPGADQMSIRVLIKSIQFEKGYMPCFSEAWSAPCRIDECPCSIICRSNVFTRTEVRH